MVKPAGFPHCGWFNGMVDIMIANGTYADYRDFLVNDHWPIVLGKEQAQLETERADKLWAAIPLEVKMERRAKLIDDSTPKWKEVAPGKVALKAVPSDNGILATEMRQLKKPKQQNRPSGSLTEENNPLLKEMDAETKPTVAEPAITAPKRESYSFKPSSK